MKINAFLNLSFKSGILLLGFLLEGCSNQPTSNIVPDQANNPKPNPIPTKTIQLPVDEPVPPYLASKGFKTIEMVSDNTLNSRVPLPANIIQTIVLGEPGGAVCEQEGSDPIFSFSKDGGFGVCNLSGNITIELRQPNGSTIPQSIEIDGSKLYGNAYTYCIPPEDILESGNYELTVNFGSRSEKSDFTIEDTPAIYLIPGTRLRGLSSCFAYQIDPASQYSYFVFTRFQPSEKLYITLYKVKEQDYEYLTYWFGITDKSGKLVQKLNTSTINTGLYILRAYGNEQSNGDPISEIYFRN